MNAFIARNRANIGIAAILGGLFYFLLPEDTGYRWGDVFTAVMRVVMLLLVIAGGWALFSSPYMRILYREAPLRRATSGVTDLDERELALRDRANGLTYYLFAAVNLLLLVGTSLALRFWDLELDGDLLMTFAVPYSYFALALPVLMLEWFEPSHLWAQPIDDDFE